MPQLNNINSNSIIKLVWHGVVFVRYGIYKEGKFKFKIIFDGFPAKTPKVHFMSEIYHPLVHPETGLLDLGNELEK